MIGGDSAVSLLDDSGEPSHKDSIRAIRYGANGKLFVSAGDDKVVKIWSTETWQCIDAVCSEKRESAVAISNDSQYVCFADKFGVVWVVNLHALDRNQKVADYKAAPLLAHYCSIITSLQAKSADWECSRQEATAEMQAFGTNQQQMVNPADATQIQGRNKDDQQKPAAICCPGSMISNSN